MTPSTLATSALRASRQRGTGDGHTGLSQQECDAIDPGDVSVAGKQAA
ncbi:MAG: hypothetical protein NZM94_07365 [Roseiflexus sp.]|nr:hypothetical protein [Roseiflexus sp.]